MNRAGFSRCGSFLTLAVAMAVVACLNAGPAYAEPPPRTYEVETYLDVAYYEGEDADPVRHKLDLYLPKGAKDYPVLMLYHGGAWLMGSKSYRGRYPEIARCFASQGIGMVLPNYRLSPAVRHPEHIKDTARSFAWTHANIARYGGGPNQIFVSGHSSGGHLAALLATDDKYLKAHNLPTSAIKGVIGVSGVYRIPDLNLTLNWTIPAGDSVIEIDRPDMQLAPFRLVFGNDSKVRRDASPIYHVRQGLPPFLVVWGTRDLPTIPLNARDFTTALKDARCEVISLELPGRNHWTTYWGANTPDDVVVRSIVGFIDKHRSSRP